jgi:hypothetical protein
MSEEISVQVKWMGPNTLYIKTGDGQRIYLSKKELKNLKTEIEDFMEFYSTDFSEERISNTDAFGDDDGL